MRTAIMSWWLLGKPPTFINDLDSNHCYRLSTTTTVIIDDYRLTAEHRGWRAEPGRSSPAHLRFGFLPAMGFWLWIPAPWLRQHLELQSLFSTKLIIRQRYTLFKSQIRWVLRSQATTVTDTMTLLAGAMAGFQPVNSGVRWSLIVWL